MVGVLEYPGIFRWEPLASILVTTNSHIVTLSPVTFVTESPAAGWNLYNIELTFLRPVQAHSNPSLISTLSCADAQKTPN